MDDQALATLEMAPLTGSWSDSPSAHTHTHLESWVIKHSIQLFRRALLLHAFASQTEAYPRTMAYPSQQGHQNRVSEILGIRVTQGFRNRTQKSPSAVQARPILALA